MIKATQLTENEKELLKLTGAERYFIFDVDLSRISSQRLEYRVDYYKKGKFVERLVDGAISGLSSGEEKQRFVWSQIKTGNNQDEVWTISFADSSMSQQVTIPEQIRAMSWSQNEFIPTVHLGEEILLAAIVGSEDGEIRSPGIIFDAKEGGIQSLRHYDMAYILTVVFDAS